MAIVIDSATIPGTTSLLFFVLSGISSSFYAGFEWYLNDVLVSTESTYTLVSPNGGDRVYARIKDYVTNCPTIYWHGGQFYGGTFIGNFSGGNFHYGSLNGAQYPNQLIKPIPFIQKI